MTKSFVQEPVSGRGAVTRQLLIRAAIELVAERGWAGVTTRAVAERAGVNHGLVHYHFGSVEGLLVKAATEALVDAANESLAILEQGDFVEGLRGGLRALISAALDGPLAAVNVEFLLQACRREDIKTLFGQVLGEYRNRLSDRLKVAMERNEVSTTDADGAAALLAALFDGLLLHVIADPSLDTDSAIAALATWMTGREEGG